MTQKTIKILFGITFLLFNLLIVNFINDRYLSHIIKNQLVLRKEESYQNYISTLLKKEIKYAFFGDSHTADNINPNFIFEAYNFGSSGENYIKSYYKLKKTLEKDTVRINTVIFEVDMHTFASPLKEPGIQDELYYYSKFIPISEIAQINDESNLNIWIKANFPSFGKGEDFLSIPSLSNLTIIDRGWTAASGNFSLKSSKEKITDSNIVYERHFENKKRIGKITFSYFIKSLKLADSNNCHIILIKYPVSKEYQAALIDHKIEKDDYYQTISDATENVLGKKPLFLDYYTLFNNHQEYFYDPDHLNKLGSEILSSQISKDLSAL